MLLDEIDQRRDCLGEHLTRHAEAALDRADVGHAPRTFLENGKSFPTQATAESIGRIKRETPLALHMTLEGATDFSGRQLLDVFSMETHGLDGAHDFVTRMGEEMQTRFLDAIEA